MTTTMTTTITPPPVLTRRLTPGLPMLALLAGVLGLLYLTATRQLHAQVGSPYGSHEKLVSVVVAGAVLLLLARARAWAGPRGVALIGAASILLTAGQILTARWSAPDPFTPWPALGAVIVFVATGTLVSRRRQGLLHAPAAARSSGWLLLGLAGVLLLLPLVPHVGVTTHGARITVNLAGHRGRPGEIGRVLAAIGIASVLLSQSLGLSVLNRRLQRLPDRRTWLTCIGAGMVPLGLMVASKDMGPALLTFTMIAVTLFVVSGRKRYPLIAAAVATVGSVVLYQALPYLRLRVTAWEHPFGTNGLLTQTGSARYALAWAGLTGPGLGSIPRAHAGSIAAGDTDFAIVTLGASLGLIFLLGLLMSLSVLCTMAWLFARDARRGHEQVRTVALACLLGFQALLIMGGLSGLIPLSGVTTVLLSSGNSSIYATMLMLALIVTTPQSPTVGGADAAAGRRLRRTITALGAMTAVAIAGTGVAFVNQVRDNTLNSSNRDPLLQLASATARGTITTADQRTVAITRNAGDREHARRDYPGGSAYFDLVGVAVPFGPRSGLERLGATLRCGQPLGLQTPTGNPAGCRPADLHLTIDDGLQQIAAQSLAGKVGALVALDAQTGAVLAWTSSPTALPTDASGATPGDAIAAWKDLENDPAKPLDSRVIGTVTQPGSGFKIVTLAAALRAQVSTYVTAMSSLTLDNGYVLGGHGVCGGGSLRDSIADALAVSCNPWAATLAGRAGPKAIADAAHALGGDITTVSGLPVSPIRLPSPTDSRNTTAMSGIGQGPAVTATLLGMSTVLGTIANDGVRRSPYVVATVCRGGHELSGAGAGGTRGYRALLVKDAKTIQTAMRAVVTRGTATALRNVSHPVYAKTGTAQTTRGHTSAWLLGYTTDPDGRKIVVGALVLPTSQVPAPVGGDQAAALAQPLLDAVATTRATRQGSCS